MPVLTPNTADAEDMTASEPGTYPARIAACDVQKSAKGNNMIVPTLKITVNGSTKTRKAYHVVEGPGSGTFDQLLRAVNMDKLADVYRDKSVANKPPFDTDVLLGQNVQVVLDNEIYEGQKRDSVKGYLRA